MTAKSYTFNNQPVLVLFDSENNPWFKASNIASALGYTCLRKAIKRFVDETNKVTVKHFPDVQKQYSGNIDNRTVFINESALWSLILSSSKPEVKLLIKNGLPDQFCLSLTNLKE